MVSRARALSLSILMLAMSFAGCIGAKDTPTAEAEPEGENLTGQNFAENATLPEDRGESAGLKETNKTEEGSGGIEHKHDYWKGQEQVVVFEGTVQFSDLPVYPYGQGSDPKGVAYIKLPQPTLIYEGAVRVDVMVTNVAIHPECAIFVCSGDTFPASPGTPPPSTNLRLSYRTAAASEFSTPAPITPGTATSIPVNAKETDMPHSVSSLWAFAIDTDKMAGLTADVTITAVRGADVVDWPGHPDFYADAPMRTVMDEQVKVHRSGIDEFALYGAGSSWNKPSKLISYGTGFVDVFVNITSATASNGAQPTGFFLEYHNATILDAEDEFNDRIDDEVGGRAFEDAYYHFVVPVEPAGMDGPYQPESLWGFRIVATFAETPVASLCPGCFPYDVEYHMKIVAHEGNHDHRINE